MNAVAIGVIIFLLFLNTVLLALLAYALLQMAIRFQKTARSLEARMDRIEDAGLPALQSLRNILATLEQGVRGFGAVRSATASGRSFATFLEWAKALGLVDLLGALAARILGHRRRPERDSDGEDKSRRGSDSS
jgi:hypothetical protein